MVGPSEGAMAADDAMLSGSCVKGVVVGTG